MSGGSFGNIGKDVRYFSMFDGEEASPVMAELTCVGNEEAKPGYSTIILDCLLDWSIFIGTLVVDVIVLVRSVEGKTEDDVLEDGPAP